MKMIIVENDKDMSAIIRDVLKEEGYSVSVVRSGEIALNRIKREQFDLMLLDYKLSGISGLTVLERLRKMKPLMKVIMMSAFADEAVKRKARELRACAFLDKPFSIKRMAAVVKKALKRK
ncbi:MAG: response regulator [Candidatus Omnitrophica bacterium]|nr:response regulator [Candidatus Omnitrophota bacterium]